MRHRLFVTGLLGLTSASCGVVLGIDEFEDAAATTGAGGDATTTGPGSTSGGGEAGAGGSGGGDPCEPGAREECPYTGPAETDGVGVCVRGARECNARGTAFGPCEGEVVPRPTDDCATAEDENCSGESNEDCACSPGSTAECYSGPPETKNVGPCRPGQHTCQPDGTGYGECIAELLPGTESCTVDGDEDCDGEANEDGADCVCVPGSAATCYSGAPETENVGICLSGTAICEPQGTGFGDCNGEVLPQTESCQAPQDEDCSGAACSSHIWSDAFGDSLGQQVNSSVVDPAGNIYIVGSFEGSIDFGGGQMTAVGKSDVFVAKLAPNGAHLWSNRFGDLEYQTANDVAVDAAGNVIVVGSFDGSVNFGGNNLTTTFADAFVAKFGPGGAHVWSQKYGSAIGNQVVNGVAVDGNGNLIITGSFESSITFGATPHSSTGTSDKDGFIAKLGPTGAAMWSFDFGDAVIQDGIEAVQAGTKVATDATGNAYVVGQFQSVMSIPGGNTFTSAGGHDIFVVKLSPAGGHLWSKRFGDASSQTTADVAVNAAGDTVAFAGELNGTVNFGGANMAGQGFGDALFVALDTAGGAHKLSKSHGVSGPDTGSGIAFDPMGNLLATGRFANTVSFGGGDFTAQFIDLFLVKMDPAGNHIWSKTFGANSVAQGNATVNADPMGNVILAATGRGGLDFGGGVQTGGGNTEVFLAKFNP